MKEKRELAAELILLFQMTTEKQKQKKIDKETSTYALHECYGYSSCDGMHFNRPQMLCKGNGRDYPDFSIAMIGQNTEKSPGHLGICLYSDSSEGPSSNAGVKNLQRAI